MSARRLLFVVNDAAFFVSHRLSLALAARDAGYEVHVATADASAAAPIRSAGLPLHPVPFTRRGTSVMTEIRAPLTLAEIHRRIRPDLVHHVTSKAILYGWLAARVLWTRRPAIVNAVTGLGYVFTSEERRVTAGRRAMLAWYRVALRAGRSITIFQNEDDRNLLANARTDIPSVVIPGAGVDVSAFTARPEPGGIPLVVFPGRMLRHKGVGEFIQAATILRARGVKARFALVGGADPGNPTVVSPAVLRDATATGDVEWWGERDDMPAVLAQSTLVCLPSYREGAPKSLLEAAAAGRAIVTTDVPGCRAVVRHGETGLLVPPRDAGALADALEVLLRDAPRRARMGHAGRALAESEFALPHIIERTLAVYDRVLSV